MAIILPILRASVMVILSTVLLIPITWACSPRGPDGVACWDVNGNNIGETLGDPEEDTNGDGVFDSNDCSGSLYFACWDINYNGIADGDEDINGDGLFNSYDCHDIDPTNGQICLNRYYTYRYHCGAKYRSLHNDGVVNVLDCTEVKPISRMCWDTNGSGLAEPEEDVNGDGRVNPADCVLESDLSNLLLDETLAAQWQCEEWQELPNFEGNWRSEYERYTIFFELESISTNEAQYTVINNSNEPSYWYSGDIILTTMGWQRTSPEYINTNVRDYNITLTYWCEDASTLELEIQPVYVDPHILSLDRYKLTIRYHKDNEHANDEL